MPDMKTLTIDGVTFQVVDPNAVRSEVVTEVDLTNFPASGFTEIVDGETIEHTSSYDESTGILTIDGVTIKLPVEGAT